MHRLVPPAMSFGELVMPYLRGIGSESRTVRWKVITNCGHVVQVEQFEAAAALTKVFLDS
jgi:hypothetical protein